MENLTEANPNNTSHKLIECKASSSPNPINQATPTITEILRSLHKTVPHGTKVTLYLTTILRKKNSKKGKLVIPKHRN